MSRQIPIASARDFAEVMRSHRLDQGLTQEELAHRVEKSRKWVMGVEKGDIMPTLPAVIAVIRALGYTFTLSPNDPAQADLLALVLDQA